MMPRVHPKIIGSNEAEIKARRRANDVRWRDVLLMIPLAILAIAFPVIAAHVYTLFFVLVLLLTLAILRVQWREWRIWPHRFTWIHFFVMLYLMICLLWLTGGMFIGLLRHYGLL